MDEKTSDSPRGGTASHPDVGGLLAGRYRVRSRLGRGATKEVFLAYDERLDREVALAIVVGAGTDLARARVTREAQVTGRLGDHPNVITVYDSGELDGLPYLVLRAMRGGSLADLLDRARPSYADAIRLAGEIASALAHAHAHGVVHRDVKPDNVWLAADGSAALGDFGVAHQAGLARLTAEGIVVGTVRYLSPEQIRGDEIGPAGDLYALGVTLYELVAGRPPFTAPDPSHVLTQHLTVVPEAPSRHDPALPPALERLILQLLAKQPARRPPSAAAVVEALASILPPSGGAGPARVDAARPREQSSPDIAGSIPAAPRQRVPDARRVVSVLAVGADVDDPEALHGVLDRCCGIIEHHGGSVERYLGDALVAIFGLAGSHGDDTLRAARAAIELSAATAELRLGIDAGEVFLRDGPRGPTITGAPISCAARLAERAEQGEILLGDTVREAVGGSARIDAASGRLLELHAEQPALLRAPGTPFVGRARELGVLLDAFARVRDERTCRLVTVVGAPGIGKSRLAGEFLTALRDGATVLAGRCLAYGEGTTYRALVDIVRGLGGDPRQRIEELLADDEQAVGAILGAVGLSDEPAQAEETAWALRRLLRRLARDRPVVVAVEDIHWADTALLDLLDHVVALSSESPILIVCLSRPELLESRPSWGVTQPNRAVLTLGALADGDARELAERLGAGAPAARIAQRAEGNPLFVEQLVAVDAGQDESELPTSIQAALATRIDALGDEERMLLQRAAVEGRTFHGGLLAALLPEHERRAVAAALAALARKGLIGVDQPTFTGQDAFRFTHTLIREAAYAGLPKLLRAQLHATAGAWLGERRADAEIVGFQFERACLLRRELGHDGEPEAGLAGRAAEHLETASHAALARGHAAVASGLLERAITVVANDTAASGMLMPALGEALFEAGRMTDALRVLDEAIAAAPVARLQARARVEREFVRLETDTGAHVAQSLRVAQDAQPVLEHEGDDHGQCRLWSLRARVAWMVGRLADADDAWRHAADCAHRAGRERDLLHVLGWRATAAVLGPTPVAKAIELCDEIATLVVASPVSVAWTHNALAVVHAMNEDFELAERFLERANATFDELGSLSSSVSHHEAFVRMLAGRPDLAELELAAGLQRLSTVSDTDSGLLATTTAMLAQAVCAQGRTREAADLCDATDARVAPDDNVTRAISAGVRARVLARDGDCGAAEARARDAISLLADSDLLWHRGDALLDLAEVLATCGRPQESQEAVETALELYESKGNLAAANRARSLLSAPKGE